MENTTTVSSDTAKTRNLLTDRKFLLLWIGQGISTIGDSGFTTLLVLWVITVIAAGQSWAPLAVGSIVISMTLPVIVVGPFAGVFADRWNKRLTASRMDILRTVLMLLLAVGAFSLKFVNVNQIPHLLLLAVVDVTVFLSSVCGQFFTPAYNGLFVAAINEHDRPRALGFMQSWGNLVALIGPPLATLLFFRIGVLWLLVFDALTYVVSFLTLLAVHVSEVQKNKEQELRPDFFREFREGIDFYVRNSILMTMLVGVVLAAAVEGAVNNLDIFFLTRNLHTPVVLYGLLATATGLGLTMGGLIVGHFAQRIGLLRILWVSLLMGGLFVLTLSRLTSFVPALVVQSLIGFSIGSINVAVGPLLLKIVPSNLIGRAVSILTPSLLLAATLSVVVTSYLGSVLNFHIVLLSITFGPIDTIFTVGGVIFTISGLYAMIKLKRAILDS